MGRLDGGVIRKRYIRKHCLLFSAALLRDSQSMMHLGKPACVMMTFARNAVSPTSIVEDLRQYFQYKWCTATIEKQVGSSVSQKNLVHKEIGYRKCSSATKRMGFSLARQVVGELCSILH